MAVQHARHYRFTVEQYQRLAREGHIAPDARVELIDGEIVEMRPTAHSSTTGTKKLSATHVMASSNTGWWT